MLIASLPCLRVLTVGTTESTETTTGTASFRSDPAQVLPVADLGRVPGVTRGDQGHLSRTQQRDDAGRRRAPRLADLDHGAGPAARAGQGVDQVEAEHG